MNENELAVLAKVRGWFEQAVQSAAYAAWRAEAEECWNFYDGAQWTGEEVQKLAEQGQPALVINKIASRIDNVAGSEVAGRTRVVYRSRSGNAEEEAAAQAMTDVALWVAERSEQAQELSRVFKAGLVGGIGWLDVGVEESHEGPQIFARAEDEFSVVWDPLASRIGAADSRFVARERWLDEAALVQLFPEHSAKVLARLKRADGFGMVGNRLSGGGLNGGLSGGSWALAAPEVAYVDGTRGRYRVVEVQHRQLSKQWRVRLPDGRLVATFERSALKALRGGVVEEVVQVPRVWVACFSEQVLLDHRPLAYGHNQFTLLPLVFKQHRADGRPYGMVRSALDPQRELNKRRSKAMHLLSTAQVIADLDAVEDPNVLAREAARPDGVILKRPGKEVRIIRHTDLAAGQVQIMEQAGRDLQDVLGVFDENLGKASNAQSGLAIAQRQQAGSLNQMCAFDALRWLKRGLGEQVLGLIRQIFRPDTVLQVVDRMGAARQVRLDRAGMQSLPPGVWPLHQGTLDVVVEEVRDVTSARELEAMRLQQLLDQGVPVPPQVLVKASGVQASDAILTELRKAI
jgi:hypothetical protein